MVESDTACREPGCDAIAIGAGYCRLHYIQHWEQLKKKEEILRSGMLEKYAGDLIARFPQDQIRALRQDLESDDTLRAAIDEIEAYETEGEADFSDIPTAAGGEISDVEDVKGLEKDEAA
jgi:hypothetical protein